VELVVSAFAKQRDRAPVSGDFTAFYRSEAPGQVRRAALLTGSDDIANDVVHEALTAMYRRWGEIAEPGPYLNRAVLNGCRDRSRRAATQVRLVGRLARRRDDTADHDVLTDVLRRLPFNHRAAVVLRYYAGYTTDEIAVALDCAPGSVGPWIDRALRRLKEELS
jgi:RNA polymerase sigma factor (sigma-70 family)